MSRVTEGTIEFYTQSLDCHGIPVRAAAVVAHEALEEVCVKIDRMLRNIPEVRQRLIACGSEFHVIGKDQHTTDLPEFACWRGITFTDNLGQQTTMDERMRGSGGLQATCAEEIILNLPGNRYPPGQDICTHEFAHTIMDYGLTAAARKRVVTLQAAAVEQGFWKGSYAATDAKEYWAELSMWFFGGHGDRTGDAPRDDGPEALRAYDPEGYALLAELYGLAPDELHWR